MVHMIQGREVGDIGLGLLGLTWTRGKNSADGGGFSDEEAFKVMKTALDLGCNYWNGGEFYGPETCNSLTLLRGYFERYPEDADRVVVNIKGCVVGERFQPDGSPEGVRRSVENCVCMLGVDEGGKGRIDQFEPARKDPLVPIETTVGALTELVGAGRIGGVALSEVSAETIRRAAKAGKVEAVEIELSLWETSALTNGVVRACAELDIPILAYSPLGRGALTGKINSLEDIPTGDFRRLLPRFQPDALAANLKLVRELEKLAVRKGCTPAQIAINWLVALSRRPGMPRIIPIPGTTSVERARENATQVELTDADMIAIDGLLANFPVVGARYHAHGMGLLDTA